jgi:hypothetical protein
MRAELSSLFQYNDAEFLIASSGGKLLKLNSGGQTGRS